MAALTQDRDTPAKHLERVEEYGVLANAIIFNGALTMLTSAGFLTPGADTAGAVVAGRAGRQVNATGFSNGALKCPVHKGVFGFAASANLAAAAAANLLRTVFIQDDQTVGLAADLTNDIPAGRLEQVDGTIFYVSVGLGE